MERKNNVIKVSKLDWDTLSMLKKSIKYYLDNYDTKYDSALSKTKKLYLELIEDLKAA